MKNIFDGKKKIVIGVGVTAAFLTVIGTGAAKGQEVGRQGESSLFGQQYLENAQYGQAVAAFDEELLIEAKEAEEEKGRAAETESVKAEAGNAHENGGSTAGESTSARTSEPVQAKIAREERRNAVEAKMAGQGETVIEAKETAEDTTTEQTAVGNVTNAGEHQTYLQTAPSAEEIEAMYGTTVVYPTAENKIKVVVNQGEAAVAETPVVSPPESNVAQIIPNTNSYITTPTEPQANNAATQAELAAAMAAELATDN